MLLKVDRFAFTSNNITYAALGDQLKYWHLFPAPDGFGIVPVWGFGEVIESRHEDIKPGERLFGYLPMSTHLTIEPMRVSEKGLFDGAAHRQEVSPVLFFLFLRFSQGCVSKALVSRLTHGVQG